MELHLKCFAGLFHFMSEDVRIFYACHFNMYVGWIRYRLELEGVQKIGPLDSPTSDSQVPVDSQVQFGCQDELFTSTYEWTLTCESSLDQRVLGIASPN